MHTLTWGWEQTLDGESNLRPLNAWANILTIEHHHQGHKISFLRQSSPGLLASPYWNSNEVCILKCTYTNLLNDSIKHMKFTVSSGKGYIIITRKYGFPRLTRKKMTLTLSEFICNLALILALRWIVFVVIIVDVYFEPQAFFGGGRVLDTINSWKQKPCLIFFLPDTNN